VTKIPSLQCCPELLLRLQESNGGDFTDMQNFINFYNYYNYCKLVQPLYSVKDNLDKYLKEGFSHTKINNDATETDTKNKTSTFEFNIEITEINNIFEYVGLGKLKINNQDVNYINVRQLYANRTGILIENLPTHRINHINTMNKCKSGVKHLVSGITDLLKLPGSNEQNITTKYLMLLKDYYDDIENNKEYNPYYKYQKELKINIFDKTPTSNKFVIQELGATATQQPFHYPVSTMNHWNEVYLNNMHCSIRYQGNFIVRTLKQMETYIKKIQENPKNPDNNYFPGNVLVKKKSCNWKWKNFPYKKKVISLPVNV
jgi:hypothetical protein